MEPETSLAALWWAVIFSGVYHGINPGMGWPLAVSAALMSGMRRDLARALGLLALGHLAAMLVILLPFSALGLLTAWQGQIRVGAGLLVMAVGVYLLVNPRHPRALARVHPARLALWSFLAATAHGAALMLVPIYLGLTGAETGAHAHAAGGHSMGADVSAAVSVAALHTAVMAVSGGLVATAVYFWLGLKFLSRSWFNLDRIWALSLVIVGAAGAVSALWGH